MESAIFKPLKPSSSISETVSKFAKVCRLRSLGVFSSENPNQNHQNLNQNSVKLGEDSSDATDSTECNYEKIHPQPVEIPAERSFCLVMKLFDSISALKLAYIRMQEAHIPYNPEMIVAANELVVAELESLCKIKRDLMKPKRDSAQLVLVRAETEVLLEDLKLQLKAKIASAIKLRVEFEDIEMGNRKLVEEIRWKCLNIMNARLLNVSTLQDAFMAASKSIHDFAKPLICLMKASGWDLDMAANSIEDGVNYLKRSHKKYVLESYIARRMFNGMSSKAFNLNNVMRFDDPIDALIDDPNSGFAQFCKEKYLLLVHQKMEGSFFGNFDHRTFVLNGKHPRTLFYQLFAKMAKCVWLLQWIVASIEPKTIPFSVKRGSYFSDVYMECVDNRNIGIISDEGQPKKVVEFMIMPGFRAGEMLLKSHVYVS